MSARGTLDGRVVLVTGATGGLGGAVTRAFVDAGAMVVASSLHGDAARGVIATALTDEAAVEALLDGVVARHGRVDALVHLAGGYEAGAAVASLSTATWRRMMALNLDAAFFACRAAVPRILASPPPRAGRVLLIGSRASVEPAPGAAAYAVSKSAVAALARTLAEEVRDDGITVNAVLPGVIDTPANRAAMPGVDTARWVPPDALARLLVFLAGDGGAVVTGALIPVSGGGGQRE